VLWWPKLGVMVCSSVSTRGLWTTAKYTDIVTTGKF
jgi:hypothetical protein